MARFLRDQYSIGYKHGDFTVISKEKFYLVPSKGDVYHRYYYYDVTCEYCCNVKKMYASKINTKKSIRCTCNGSSAAALERDESQSNIDSEKNINKLEYIEWHNQLKAMKKDYDERKKNRGRGV